MKTYTNTPDQTHRSHESARRVDLFIRKSGKVDPASKKVLEEVKVRRAKALKLLADN